MCILIQALRLCRGRTAYRGSRGILYSFLTTTLEGVRGQRHVPAALYPRKDPVPIVQEAEWAGLDRYGKSPPNRDSIPGTSSP